MTHLNLGQLFDGERSAVGAWSASELSAIWEHQLQVRLGHVVPDRPPPVPRGPQQEEPAQPAAMTFADLLFGAPPPVTTLILVKEFAKAHLANPARLLPKDIATVLYFACLACGLMRFGKSISSLAPEQLIKGFRWSLQQPWLDPSSRALLQQASEILAGKRPEDIPPKP